MLCFSPSTIGIDAAELGARGFKAGGTGIGDVIADGIQLFCDGAETGQGDIEAHWALTFVSQ
jgi:hypothetical protein